MDSSYYLPSLSTSCVCHQQLVSVTLLLSEISPLTIERKNFCAFSLAVSIVALTTGVATFTCRTYLKRCSRLKRALKATAECRTVKQQHQECRRAWLISKLCHVLSSMLLTFYLLLVLSSLRHQWFVSHVCCCLRPDFTYFTF